MPFIVGGFEVGGSDTGFELLLGYHNASGKLVYAGRAGLGFGKQQRSELHHRLSALLTDECPFGSWRRRTSGIRWVVPNLVAVIEQGAWKGAGMLREAVYRGLRDDIDPGKVAIE